MSDKQKCLIHDGFKSLDVNITICASTKVTRNEDFQVRMSEMKNIDENEYERLAKKLENQLSRAYLSTSLKSDILLNNMCETFNIIILDPKEKTVIKIFETIQNLLDVKEKPVIEIFETIQNLLMSRFQVNREKVTK